MHPLLRVTLIVTAAILGAEVGGASSQFLGGAIGVLIALAFTEIVRLRVHLAKLQTELADMRRVFDSWQVERKAASAAAPAAPLIDIGATDRVRPVPPGTADAKPAAAYTPLPHGIARDWATAEQGSPAASKPNPLIRLLRDYFTGGNTLVRAGVIVLFFGIAFLLRYVSEHTHLPIGLRLSSIAFGALLLLALGWHLRKKRRGYALALQGGAVGILYLTVFSALHLYSLISPSMAFAAMAAVSALLTTLAVSQDSLAIALLAVIGGFLAPFLASTGQGNHVALFSYFVVLNVAILSIAWFRSWRALNVAGFAFTFVLSVIWGVLQYRPQDLASSEPFLVILWLLYIGIALLFGSPPQGTRYRSIDGTIVFGVPLAAFGLQAAMLRDRPMALACSALGVSAVYLSLAWILRRRAPQSRRLLAQSFMALGIAFLTLTIPLALNARWSAASWALEGAAIIWVGCQQDRRLSRAFGVLLQLAAGAALLLSRVDSAFPDGFYPAAILIGVAAAFAAQVLNSYQATLAEYELPYSNVLFFWGVLWWCIGGSHEIRQFIDPSHTLASTLIFSAITALLCLVLALRFRLTVAQVPMFALLPAMVGCALVAAATLQHPSAMAGWLAWPLAFVALALTLWWQEQTLPPPWRDSVHALALWLLTALIAWEVTWHVSEITHRRGSWALVAAGLLPAAIFLLLPRATLQIRWPFAVNRLAYLVLASHGIGLYLACWSVLNDVLVADPASPLPYLPLLNPTDVAQAVVLSGLIRFRLNSRTHPEQSTPRTGTLPVVAVLAFIVFLALNATLLRTLHHWVHLPYEFGTLMHSTLVQASLSIFWTLLALATMLTATRIKSRPIWLTGAVLLTAVVAKLFLIDLSSIGTIERIVSFVGVGMLMLVLGYFSPLPPSTGAAS